MTLLTQEQGERFWATFRASLQEIGVDIAAIEGTHLDLTDLFAVTPQQVWRAYEIGFMAVGVKPPTDYEGFVDDCRACARYNQDTRRWLTENGL